MTCCDILVVGFEIVHQVDYIKLLQCLQRISGSEYTLFKKEQAIRNPRAQMAKKHFRDLDSPKKQNLDTNLFNKCFICTGDSLFVALSAHFYNGYQIQIFKIYCGKK